MWGFFRRNWVVDIMIIVLIVMFVTNVFRDWGFPWWLFFFVWPVFSSWKGSSEQREKQKRETRIYDADELSYEKPKREPRYALGDDGELIELPAEDDVDYKRKRSDYV